MGEPDHGHACLARARHGASLRGAAPAQAVRAHQAPHLPHHDEEHRRARHLPAGRHLHHSFPRYEQRFIHHALILLVPLFHHL